MLLYVMLIKTLQLWQRNRQRSEKQTKEERQGILGWQKLNVSPFPTYNVSSYPTHHSWVKQLAGKGLGLILSEEPRMRFWRKHDPSLLHMFQTPWPPSLKLRRNRAGEPRVFLWDPGQRFLPASAGDWPVCLLFTTWSVVQPLSHRAQGKTGNNTLKNVEVGWFERIALKHVYYNMWNRSSVQVWCMRQGAQGWCARMILRVRKGRKVGGGFRMGNTCTPIADSCQCMAKKKPYNIVK